jgi:hypothetical protein
VIAARAAGERLDAQHLGLGSGSPHPAGRLERRVERAAGGLELA